MRAWRIPIAVSIVLHGGMAVSMVLMPEREEMPAHELGPVEIEIVSVEAPKVEAPVVSEATVDRSAPKDLDEEEKRRAKRKPRTGPIAPPVTTEEGGGDGSVTVEVGPPGPPARVPGKTSDGRDLSSLDLKPSIGVPTFEEQGDGVLVPEEKDEKRRPNSAGGFDYNDSSFRAHVSGDGTVTFDGSGHSDVDGIPDFAATEGGENEAPSGGAKWTIDVNDLIMGALGDDPYSYEKRRFLEATREERLEMARAACGERLSESLADLPQRLTKIWKSDRGVEEKRGVLFDLWDDCAEDGTPEVMRYGELARLTILDFIQKHLPEGSAEAYSELEIGRLNERRSSSRKFAPYGARL